MAQNSHDLFSCHPFDRDHPGFLARFASKTEPGNQDYYCPCQVYEPIRNKIGEILGPTKNNKKNDTKGGRQPSDHAESKQGKPPPGQIPVPFARLQVEVARDSSYRTENDPGDG